MIAGAWKMAGQGRCLLHKNQDLSLDRQHPWRKLYLAAQICKQLQTGSHGLTPQSSLVRQSSQ